MIVFTLVLLVSGICGISSTKFCDGGISSLSLALYHRMTKTSRADDTTANTSVVR